MSGSSEHVNYAIRPCKSIERKMMCEIIAKLNTFDQVSNYRYIGMGAKYFIDFSLLHKEFGITKMYSMEIDSKPENKERFDFNKPYNCIQMLFGNSSDLLNSTKFNWKNEKNIIWLDYDGGIRGKQLEDIETCVSKVESGSIIFTSFNSDFGEKFKQSSPTEKIEIFKSRIQNEELVKLVKPKDLAGEKIYETINRMFDMVIKNKILERNRIALKKEDRLRCCQLVYFKYADSQAPMLTIGWIFYNDKDIEKFEKCKFIDLEFFNDTDKPYDITVPNFTYKELSILNQNMPNLKYPIEGAGFFSESEVEMYRKIYKYFPTSFETSVAL